jgi:tRNA-2-methylthio-N6-dimethylallyladenosine synthase
VKAWIPVQRGCDYRCTYCIVPTTRGSERSRRLDDVIREVEGVVADGMSEVVLLGQTVNSYDDGRHDFADLLRRVGSVPGIRRVRFTSPHPNDFSERVIAALAEVPTVCEHVHLPMQSGSTRTLKRMLRRYTREEYLECVARLRAAVPGLALTTDVIVGFPGETDEEFEETLSAVEAVGFVDAYTFIFSPRDGTPATRMPAALTVPAEVASERLQRLVALVRSAARQRNLGLLGTRHEVLVEREAKRGEAMLMTRTRDFKTVLVPGDASMLGRYLTVELTGTTGSTFTGAIVHERQPLPMAG